jgi:hypothetical protein
MDFTPFSAKKTNSSILAVWAQSLGKAPQSGGGQSLPWCA